MKDSYFVFEWVLDKGKENKIVEKIPVFDFETYLTENGTIAEEILSTCALRSIEQKSNYFAFDARRLFDDPTMDWEMQLRKNVYDYFLHENLSQENYIAINLDILEKIVRAYVYAACEQSARNVIKSSENSVDLLKLSVFFAGHHRRCIK